MRYASAAFLLLHYRYLRFREQLMIFCPLIDLLPYLRSHFTPILELILIELVDAKMMMRMSGLPSDWVKVRYQPWQYFQFYHKHIFVALLDVINHLECLT